MNLILIYYFPVAGGWAALHCHCPLSCLAYRTFWTHLSGFFVRLLAGRTLDHLAASLPWDV